MAHRTSEQRVREEVEGLHRFFVGWFSGALAESEFEDGFLRRFDAEFLLIPPAGSLQTLDDLATAVRERHATNPDFRIAIRNVTLRRRFDGHLLATYEEWQRNALATNPPDNARLATVLFVDAEPLRWLHVHETRMPPSVGSAASAGDYEF